ncbi:MAG: hypothetical protein V3T55_03280 [Anaerolineales bacterium]
MKTIDMAHKVAEKEAQQNKKDKDKQAYAKAVHGLLSGSVRVVNTLNLWSKKCA